MFFLPPFFVKIKGNQIQVGIALPQKVTFKAVTPAKPQSEVKKVARTPGARLYRTLMQANVN